MKCPIPTHDWYPRGVFRRGREIEAAAIAVRTLYAELPVQFRSREVWPITESVASTLADRHPEVVWDHAICPARLSWWRAILWSFDHLERIGAIQKTSGPTSNPAWAKCGLPDDCLKIVTVSKANRLAEDMVASGHVQCGHELLKAINGTA